jgi:hypothetical protein
MALDVSIAVAGTAEVVRVVIATAVLRNPVVDGMMRPVVGPGVVPGRGGCWKCHTDTST